MSYSYTHPHFKTRVDDQSIFDQEVDLFPAGLHKPIFIDRAERGKTDTIQFFPSISLFFNEHGNATLDNTTKYYSRTSKFIERVATRHGFFFMRVSPEDASYASAVIEAHVVTNASIPQYKKDEFGGYALDEFGDKIPETDSSNNIIKEPGVTIKFVKRVLDLNEDPATILPKTQTVNGSETKILPIVAIKSVSAGNYGNYTGLKLYCDKTLQDDRVIEKNKTLLINFSPVQKPYDSTTVDAIYDGLGTVTNQFSFDDEAVHDRTKVALSGSDMVYNNYRKTIGGTNGTIVDVLPYTVNFYKESVKWIGDQCLSFEKNTPELTSAFMVNIFSGTNLEGYEYDHIKILHDNDSIYLDKNYIVYLDGGNDGDISDEATEELIRQALRGKTFPEIIDTARFDFTHMYDTGFTLKTKEAMINFLGLRDNFVLNLSTQDCTRGRQNTRNEDLAIASYLRSRAALYPESIEFGTEVTRVLITKHSGYLPLDRKNLLPLTLEIANMRARWQSQNYITGEPKGSDYARVTLFDINSINDIEYDPDVKQVCFDNGYNYLQWAQQGVVFFPDIRTIYPYETSVLCDITFVDTVVYTKHIVAKEWPKHSGKTENLADRFSRISRRLEAAIVEMHNGRYPTVVTAYQTEAEAKLGYVTHVRIQLQGNPTDRVWIVDIPVTRDGYTEGGE